VLFFTAPKAKAATGLLHVTPLVGAQGGGVLLGGRF
jgi:hypothetical protein